MRVPLSSADLTNREAGYVEEAVRAGWISSSGQYVKKAEDAWAAFCGNTPCTLVCNGTAALHLALMSLDLKPGDEVIVPGMTFVSPAAVVARMGATPVLADVEDVSWCIDPRDIKRLATRKTKGVIAVDVLGHPADYGRIEPLCRELGLFLVEDAAEAHGAAYRGRRVGSFGDMATFSFFANKTVGCGEGGAVLSSKPELIEKARLLKNHGMSPARPYWHDFVGDNFRLTNVIAAILLGQIERVEELVAKRNRVSALYRELLAGLPSIELRPSAEWASVATWIEPLRVLPQCILTRDELVAALRAREIDARALWTPLADLPPYRALCEKRGIRTPKARELLSQLLWLPTASNMKDGDVEYVADTVRKALGGER
jgi:perosamine synthetase